MAMMFCMKMATLLVQFATVGGRPMKISMGRVRKDPPPARTFRNLAMVPTRSSKRALKAMGLSSTRGRG